jgi:hypothetical protein
MGPFSLALSGPTLHVKIYLPKNCNMSQLSPLISGHFRNKKRQYLRDKINELQSNSKNKNIRGLYRGTNKKGYQPRTNLVKTREATYLRILKIWNAWKNNFCQLLNVHGAGGVKQTEMHTAEPSVPQPSASEAEVAIGKLKRYKSPGADQIPAELILAGGEILRLEFHRLTKFISNKAELPHQWKESIVVPIHKKGEKADCSSSEECHCCQL